jgi:hypothetical protein
VLPNFKKIIKIRYYCPFFRFLDFELSLAGLCCGLLEASGGSGRSAGGGAAAVAATAFCASAASINRFDAGTSTRMDGFSPAPLNQNLVKSQAHLVPLQVSVPVPATLSSFSK